MSRKEVLARLGFEAPPSRVRRVIVHTDIKNEADDPFAIMHHLMTPTEEVVGIIAGHNEWMPSVAFPQRAAARGMTTQELADEIEAMGGGRMPLPGTTMETSYQAGRKILKLADMEEIPLLRGAVGAITDVSALPESEGADFIIAEAMKDDPRPLYVAMLGGMTDLAVAYLKKPEIADKIIAIMICGGPYPQGGDEFNMKQDIKAVQILFDSPMELWQIPNNAFKPMEISFAELLLHVKPCGEIGAYLWEQLREYCMPCCARNPNGVFPVGEVWDVGDNCTVGVLLASQERQLYHMEHAPAVRADCTYEMRQNSKLIRVYDEVDARLTLHDFMAKLKLCYGMN